MFWKFLQSVFRLQLLLCCFFFFLMEKKYLSGWKGGMKKMKRCLFCPFLLCFNWSDSRYICTCFKFRFARMTHFTKTPLKGLSLTFYRQKYLLMSCCPPVVSDVFYHSSTKRDVTAPVYCWTLSFWVQELRPSWSVSLVLFVSHC